MSGEILDDLDFGKDEDSEMEYHLRIFIGKRKNHYLEYWRKPRFISFDFLKMLVGIPWMFYRKMYYLALVLIFIFMFSGTTGLFNIVPIYGFLYLLEDLVGFYSFKLIIDICILVATLVSCGFFSKKIYLWHAVREVKRLRGMYKEEQLILRLEEKGGTEGFVPTVILLILLYYLTSQTSLGLNTILTF